MASSVVDICNQALYLLGANVITSLADGTRTANLCNLLWYEVLDTVLRDHPWNCAIVRDELAQDASAPEYEFDYRYQLPADPYCLRLLGTDQDTYVGHDGNQYYEYKIEGRYILTNSTTLKIKYIGRITDVAQYDSLLVGALAAKLASELAFPITKSHQVVNQMGTLYQGKLSDAKAVDAQEGAPDYFDAPVLWNARLS